jgi:hypothetical protein
MRPARSPIDRINNGPRAFVPALASLLLLARLPGQRRAAAFVTVAFVTVAFVTVAFVTVLAAVARKLVHISERGEYASCCNGRSVR